MTKMVQTRNKRILSVLTCLALLLAMFTVTEYGQDRNVAALASPAADAPASVIRVKLSTGSVTEISFTISGIYGIESRVLEPGTYKIRNENGLLNILDKNGRILQSSQESLLIKEYANPDSGSVNTISLQAGGVLRQYQGSMKFWVADSVIEAVNHVFLEKYLYGVVAYEMSDGFPLEALKAQAVAARCYSVKRLEGIRGARFDIGDTSSDQVYKGYNAQYTRVIRAIDETDGQVLTYNQSIINAFYSASNGGQTDRSENVWSSALPYLKIRNDPYDLANPGSKQAVVLFPVGSRADKPEDAPLLPPEPTPTPTPSPTVRYAEDDMDTRLIDFLRSMALQKLTDLNGTLPENQKYALAPESIRIKAILEMTAVPTDATPRCVHHAESTDQAPHDATNCPSIDMTGVKMTVLLKVSQLNPESTAPDRLVRTDLEWLFQFKIADYLKSAVYPQWQVFLPGNGLRIYAVERFKDSSGLESFKLINRRYGHGLGLSQRGAQQRANDPDPGVNAYDKILSFYYPGTTLVPSTLEEPALPPAPDNQRLIAFVERFYQAYLGRSADEAGLAYWMESLGSKKQTAADVAVQFANSPEFLAAKLDQTAFLNTMYQAFFVREPDSSGMDYWLDLMSKGMSRYWVQSRFVDSGEFQLVCDDADILRGRMPLTQPADLHPDMTMFVARFYQLTLLRMPDEGGLNYWVGELQSGRLKGATFAGNIVLGKEFVDRKTTNDEFVTIMYKAFFDRDPDAAGFKFWLDALKLNRMTRRQVLAGFVNSTEFSNICKRYGIERGTLIA